MGNRPDVRASVVRGVERRGDTEGLPPRARFGVRFADGGRLELGERTAVMGVLNLTPDSFSDGGRHASVPAALKTAMALAGAGADLIDVGGESTRPGAAPVDAEEETRRVVPAIEAIRRESAVRVSIDTMKADVARRAFDAGADLLNDVSALEDPAMLALIASRGVPVVLMHMRGTPATMQRDTAYDDLLDAILRFLQERAGRAVDEGVDGDKIVVDPGIGFGKSTAGNLALLERLPELAVLGLPILIGASRKRFIGEVLDLPVDGRLEGSLAIAALAVVQGAHIIRTHDVEATRRFVRMIDAVREARCSSD